jgi:hypothetical protein
MPVDWIGDATFSKCGKYRYSLVRAFLHPGPKGPCAFIMLNPSTATGEVSDPTVRRCEGYARAWGHKALIVLNIFAFRSTDPKALYRELDPVGPENDDYIEHYCKKAAQIVCAWGLHGKHLSRGRVVLAQVAGYRPCYLKLTKGGVPSHPLYLKGDLKPTPFVFVEPMAAH